MDSERRRTAILAVIMLMIAYATGEPDPKPIVVNYFDIPASQFPPETYRYDPRANNYARYTQSAEKYPTIDREGGGYLIADPQHGTEYPVSGEYQPVSPRVTDRYHHHGDGQGEGGYVNPPAVTARPLQHNNRDFPEVAADYKRLGLVGATTPHYDPSYNGIVRKAGVAEDGRDYRGEPGMYAIRGGVFPAVDYERPEQQTGGYYFQPTNFYPIPTHIAPNGDFYGNFRAHEPYAVNAARPRPLGYSSEIHARGDENNPSADEREDLDKDNEKYDDNYDVENKRRYDDRKIGKEGYVGHQQQPVYVPRLNPSHVGYGHQDYGGNQERDRIDNQRRGSIENQERGRIDNRERGRIDNQERGRIDNQERGRIDNQERGYLDNQQRRYTENQQREYPVDRQRVYPGNQHDGYRELGHEVSQRPNYIGHQERDNAVNQQMPYPENHRPQYVVHRQQMKGDHRGEQIPTKIPVRGVNSKDPQVFYPTERNDAVTQQYN